MLCYKNLDLTPGISASFQFNLLDDNYVQIDVTGYTFKFEIFDKWERLVYTKSIPDASGLGTATFNLSPADTASIAQGVYSYRLVITDTSSFSNLVWKGFIAAGEPAFSPTSTPITGTVTLPDGTIYATTATTLAFGVWYATSSYMRFLVSGIGTLTIDGRDINGTFYINLGVYQSQCLDQVQWNPNLAGMNAFRINQASGSNTVQFLP